jgi:hypothetical protein
MTNPMSNIATGVPLPLPLFLFHMALVLVHKAAFEVFFRMHRLPGDKDFPQTKLCRL